MAWSMGLVFGVSKGPLSWSGGPTRKLPVKVLAKPDSFGFSSSCRATTQRFCGSPSYFPVFSAPRTM